MMIRRWITGALVSILLVPLSVFSLELDTAKAQGLVGEEPSGYLGVVVPSAEASALVQDINQKRREMYGAIAKKNGTPLNAVEALAGKKAIDATKPGAFVRGTTGAWQRR